MAAIPNVDFRVVGHQQIEFFQRFDKFIGCIALLTQRAAEFHCAFGKRAGLLAFKQRKFAIFFQQITGIIDAQDKLLVFRIIHQNEGIAAYIGWQIRAGNPCFVIADK